MNSTELRSGNLILWNGSQYRVTALDIAKLETYPGENVKAEGIALTEEWLLRAGFNSIPHFTVTNSKWIDLGRNRRLSIGCVGTPNLMVWLEEVDGKVIKDLICLHNWDYDGNIHIHQLQNLFHSLTGQELTIKQD